MLTERNSIDPAGLVRDPSAPSFGGWLSHSTTEHPGAIAFLAMDIFLFFGVAVLTFVQASQVRCYILSPPSRKTDFFLDSTQRQSLNRVNCSFLFIIDDDKKYNYFSQISTSFLVTALWVPLRTGFQFN